MMSGFQVGREYDKEELLRTESTSDLAERLLTKLMAKAE